MKLGRHLACALLVGFVGLMGACASMPGLWTADSSDSPPEWPPDAMALARLAPRPECLSGGATAAECARGCRVDVVREGSETAVFHTRDGRYGAQVTRFENGRIEARRWAQGAAGRIDDFASRTQSDGAVVSDPVFVLAWMAGSALDHRPPDLAHRRVFDPRSLAPAPSSPRECPRVEETIHGDNGCWQTTVRECDVVHLRFGQCGEDSLRIERTVAPDGSVSIREENGSEAETHRDDDGRIVSVRGVHRLFSREGDRMTVDVMYDASGRLLREHAFAERRRYSRTRTLVREYDEAGRLAQSEVTSAYTGTDELEGLQDVVQYRYGPCDYAITALAPEPRHVALTESNVDWMAGDILSIR